MPDENRHPVIPSAASYISKYLNTELVMAITQQVKTAPPDSATKACFDTIQKLRKDEPITDAELFGLAWFLREIVTKANKQYLEENPSCISKSPPTVI